MASNTAHDKCPPSAASSICLGTVRRVHSLIILTMMEDPETCTHMVRIVARAPGYSSERIVQRDVSRAGEGAHRGV